MNALSLFLFSEPEASDAGSRGVSDRRSVTWKVCSCHLCDLWSNSFNHRSHRWAQIGILETIPEAAMGVRPDGSARESSVVCGV